MQAQSVAPLDMVCKDKFLIQSTVVPIETTIDDITSTTMVNVSFIVYIHFDLTLHHSHLFEHALVSYLISEKWW